MHVKSCREDAPVNGRRVWVQLSHGLLLLMLVAYMYHVTSINQIRPPLLALGLYAGAGHGRLPPPWAEPCQSRDRQSQNLALHAVSSSVICLPEFYTGDEERARNESTSRNHSSKSPVLRFYTFICKKIRYCASTYFTSVSYTHLTLPTIYSV